MGPEPHSLPPVPTLPTSSHSQGCRHLSIFGPVLGDSMQNILPRMERGTRVGQRAGGPRLQRLRAGGLCPPTRLPLRELPPSHCPPLTALSLCSPLRPRGNALFTHSSLARDPAGSNLAFL